MLRTATRASFLASALLAACASGPKTYYEGPPDPASPPGEQATPDGTTPVEQQPATPGTEPAAPKLVGHVRLGTPKVAAAYADTLTKTLTPALTDMERCYDPELALDATLAGTVNVAFTISGAGVVTAWNATGVDTNVANCIGGVVEGLKYPAPTDKRPVKITYPFLLSSS